MAIEFGPWLRLNPPTIETIPDAPGVFEIANLVRTVLFTGRAEGSLQRRLADLGGMPANLPVSTGGYYVRLALTPDEETALAECVASYRASHAGRLPAGNENPVRPSIRLVASQRAA